MCWVGVRCCRPAPPATVAHLSFPWRPNSNQDRPLPIFGISYFQVQRSYGLQPGCAAHQCFWHSASWAAPRWRNQEGLTTRGQMGCRMEYSMHVGPWRLEPWREWSSMRVACLPAGSASRTSATPLKHRLIEPPPLPLRPSSPTILAPAFCNTTELGWMLLPEVSAGGCRWPTQLAALLSYVLPAIPIPNCKPA